jgi:tetratricopeptide (TPR) repeat protein
MVSKVRIAILAALALAALVMPAAAQGRPDALALFRQGRDLEAKGLLDEARAKYQASVDVCDAELRADSSRMESYVVKTWSLFRLQRYREVVEAGEIALKLRFDARIVETMGEAYYFLDQLELVLVSMRRYIETVGEAGDRVATAYFYMGETYMRQKRYNHAYISYAAACHYEKGMARWWFRLGQASELIADRGRALECYQKALALAPAYAEAQSAVSRLQTSASGATTSSP